MERERFIKPLISFVLKARLEHAINSGNVDAVDSLSDKLDCSKGTKGMNLVEAYGVLAAKAREKGDIESSKTYENAMHDTYKRFFPSSEV